MLHALIFLFHFLLGPIYCDQYLRSNFDNINNDVPVPQAFDWRRQNMVTPVRNEGKCAASWAFSAIAAIESHRLIYLKKNESLSEQFLIDCDMEEKGCNYSSLVKTFSNVVARIGGVPLVGDYRPYMEGRFVCVWPIPDFLPNGVLDSPGYPGYKLMDVLGFRKIKPNEEVMAEFLFRHGPLAAAINPVSMKKYKGGIDLPKVEDCDPKNLNHTVLIVGYNVTSSSVSNESTPYWIIKNSWGTEWGDDGYYRMVRGRNACGIANEVSLVFVD